jgi:hypothetical protein
MKKLFIQTKVARLRLIALIVVCCVIVAGVNSCKKEVKTQNAEAPSGQAAVKKIALPVLQSISFKSFLDSAKKLQSNALTRLLTNSVQKNGELKVNDASSSSSISLFIDSIKILKKSGHQTYTIPVKQDNPNSIPSGT